MNGGDFFHGQKGATLSAVSLELKMEAEQQVREYISFYNQSRFQKKLNNRSPAEYREAVAA
ncbi:hypothetical protein PPE_02390 [Paenibacillus polymyxa E681]|nr:hypothetical protein PPE_02390 [Paenibacillus polymyxa E681]